MKINELVEAVNKIYELIYNEKAVEVNNLRENVYELKFSKEKILIDKPVGNRYKIHFDDVSGTISEFRLKIDEALGFRMNACDIGDMIDVTEPQITKIHEYYLK